MKLGETAIRRYVNPRTFERGRDYWESGAVDLVNVDSRRVEGEVESSGTERYYVRAEADGSGGAYASCDCPYDGEGWCKHIVAVLLAAAGEREPANREESGKRDSIAAQLGELADFEREALVAQAYREVPQFAGFVRSWLGRASSSNGSKTSRREMLALARTPDLEEGTAFDGNLARLFERALTALDCDRIPEAIVHLERATALAVREWDVLDDSDGEFGAFGRSLGRAWIDAAIMLDGEPSRCRSAAGRIARWHQTLDDYGVADEIGVAVLVLEHSVAEASSLLADDAELRGELQQAELRVYARRGQVEPYLSLARKIRARAQYLAMLVHAGKLDEAAREAAKQVKSPREALGFCILLESERPDDALELGERALALSGEGSDELACWVRDVALERGNQALALRAAEAAVLDCPTLEDYRALKSIAASRWKKMRAKIVEAVKQSRNAEEAIRILIDEDLVADAIRKLEQPSVLVSYELLDALVLAAVRSHADWALGVAREQAERIMNAGKSEYYHHAGRWLRRVQAAYEASDRIEEWQKYRASLVLLHKRKLKLVAVLEGL